MSGSESSGAGPKIAHYMEVKTNAAMLALTVFPLFVPSLLDRFEFGLV